jgi:preprotein translocase subunit YajC
MNFELITTACAQAQQPAQKAPSTAPMWPMFLLLFVVFYFFIIRPQRKKTKETQSMLDNLQKGDRIITIGGICGTIVNIKEKKDKNEEDIVVIKVSDTGKLEMIRSSIAKVVSRETESAKE